MVGSDEGEVLENGQVSKHPAVVDPDHVGQLCRTHRPHRETPQDLGACAVTDRVDDRQHLLGHVWRLRQSWHKPHCAGPRRARDSARTAVNAVHMACLVARNSAGGRSQQSHTRASGLTTQRRMDVPVRAGREENAVMGMRQQMPPGAQTPPTAYRGASISPFADRRTAERDNPPLPLTPGDSTIQRSLSRPFRLARSSARPEENRPTMSDPLRWRLPSLDRAPHGGKDVTLNPTRSTARSATCRPCRRDWCPRPVHRATRAQEGRS